MTRLEELKKQARQSAKFRGHDLAPFKRWWKTGNEWTRFLAYCRMCDMQVAVDLAPAPNGIDIGGEAVALDCKGDPNGHD